MSLPIELAVAVVFFSLLGCGQPDYGSFGELSSSGPAPITAACTAAPTTLASVPGIRGDLLLVDEAALYVVAREGDSGAGSESIYRLPKSGAPAQLLAANQHGVGDIAIGYSSTDASAKLAVYWSTGALDSQPDGAIWKVAASGGTPVAVVTGRASPGPILVLGAHVYWGEGRADGAAIVWAPLGGGDVTVWQLLPGRRVPASLVFVGKRIAWTSTDADGLASNVASSTWPLSFGAAVQIDTRAGTPLPISESNGYLVLGGDDSATVLSALAEPRVRIATNGPVRHLAADNNAMYLIDTGLHALLAGLPDPLGGPPRRVATDVEDGSIRFDAACVYFVDEASHAVRMVHR